MDKEKGGAEGGGPPKPPFRRQQPQEQQRKQQQRRQQRSQQPSSELGEGSTRSHPQQKEAGKKPSSAPEQSSRPSQPQQQQQSLSETHMSLESDFPSSSHGSRGGGGGRGRARGRGRGREGRPPHGFQSPERGELSPQSFMSVGDAGPQPSRGGGRGRGRGRGGPSGHPRQPPSEPAPYMGAGDRGHTPQAFSRQQQQSQQTWQQQQRKQHGERQPRSQQLPSELKESTSTSSLSSIASQSSSAVGQSRQTPSHTPTFPPQQTGAGEQQPQQKQQQPPQQQKEADGITKTMSKVSISDSAIIPQRKSKGDVVGKKGRPIQLEVNHLLLKFKKPNMMVIHYDVVFQPDRPKRLLRLVMQEFQRSMYPNRHPAFDGRKNLYSNGYLSNNEVLNTTVTVFDEENQREINFEVTVKVVALVDMSPLIQYMNQGSSTRPPQEALQAVDIVLRSPAALRFVSIGRSFFTAPQEGRTIDLGDGLELWYGFYQSAILGWKPFLNVDVAHKGFPKDENLIEVIMNITGLQGRGLQQELGPREREALGRYINGLKIEYEIPRQPQTKRTFKVNRVMGSSSTERFEFERDGQMTRITVGEYFERFKNYRLIYPYLPCIHVGPVQKNIYVPVELCKIAKGQALMRKLNENQTAKMVRHAAERPHIRKQRILEAMAAANFNQDSTVKEFGITVSDRFTTLKGRVLDPPTLEYNPSTKPVRPVNGVWRAQQFIASKSLSKWAILNCDERTTQNAVMRFIQNLRDMGGTLGCQIDPNPTVIEMRRRSVRREEIAEKLHKCKKEQNELVVVIIPDSGHLYGKVKQAAEIDVGILTQCLKAVTVFKKLTPPTVSNILLKVNSKLNGINHFIRSVERPAALKTPIMVVGADVTHPSPDQTQIPSVAAVAASHDPKAFQYNMMWRLQPPREEIILDLENIMKAQLLFFFKKTNGYKPESIFFYRDGVSEGQFQQVLNRELQAIRRSCTALEADYKPKITFLVVQKRHHTRFFPASRRDDDGKTGNVPAGTIVDTEITHPTELDFYLVSHASIQGTARPTKYHLLWDDNEMNEDDLEELTYYLCHLFSRCTRSVSYPAPTYYAHLAAFRARAYLDANDRINIRNLPLEQNRRNIHQDIVNGSPMFFV